MNTLKIGGQAETLAKDYLIKNGLKNIASNYRCRMGEIDLIMQDGPYLVFVEVRARVSQQFGGAVASITLAKQKKIIKAAQHFLMLKNWQEKYPVRFDALCLEGALPEIIWIKDAFRDQR